MAKWDDQGAPNNNLPAKTIRSSNLIGKENRHEFSEELSDGGERDRNIRNMKDKQ